MAVLQKRKVLAKTGFNRIAALKSLAALSYWPFLLVGDAAIEKGLRVIRPGEIRTHDLCFLLAGVHGGREFNIQDLPP
jgi:hypothetical protein